MRKAPNLQLWETNEDAPTWSKCGKTSGWVLAEGLYLQDVGLGWVTALSRALWSFPHGGLIAGAQTSQCLQPWFDAGFSVGLAKMCC